MGKTCIQKTLKKIVDDFQSTSEKFGSEKNDLIFSFNVMHIFTILLKKEIKKIKTLTMSQMGMFYVEEVRALQLLICLEKLLEVY